MHWKLVVDTFENTEKMLHLETPQNIEKATQRRFQPLYQVGHKNSVVYKAAASNELGQCTSRTLLERSSKKRPFVVLWRRSLYANCIGISAETNLDRMSQTSSAQMEGARNRDSIGTIPLNSAHQSGRLKEPHWRNSHSFSRLFLCVLVFWKTRIQTIFCFKNAKVWRKNARKKAH